MYIDTLAMLTDTMPTIITMWSVLMVMLSTMPLLEGLLQREEWLSAEEQFFGATLCEEEKENLKALAVVDSIYYGLTMSRWQRDSSKSKNSFQEVFTLPNWMFILPTQEEADKANTANEYLKNYTDLSWCN